MSHALAKEINENGLESLGRYYSTYRAFVVDNEDPSNMSRLKLIIPQITGAEVYDYWAYPHGVFSGTDGDSNAYGMQVIPPKRSLVFVQFENGHPEKPVWSHGHWAQEDNETNEKPKEEQLTDVNSFWFQTPAGNRVMINDTEKLIIVKLKTGETIKINPDAISIIHEKAISLGTEDKSKEKAVLGDSHNEHESATLDGILALTVMTPMGPSSTPINFATFESQKTALEAILSKKVTLD